MGGSRALALGWPLVAGQLGATTPTLGALSLSPAVATLGVAYTGTISGATPGSNIVLDSLTVSGTGTTRTVTGTPSSTGSWAAVETLSGANGSPRTTSDILLVSAASAGIQSIRADGWSGDYASTPPTFDPVGSPVTLALTRQGFTNTGAPTTYSEAPVLTHRVQQAYPNHALKDATRVALDTYVYSTDTLPNGVTNNSAETSPKPIAKWARPPRSVVLNSIRAEVVAFHRNARNREQIACVVFTATDGTNTVTQTASSSSILGHSGDLNAVIGYGATLDITSLAVGNITLNAKVIPWIGGSAAIRDSAVDGMGDRDLAPQVHVKSPKATAPPFAYISSTGVDASGVVSTTAATAKATPFLTVQGALTGLKNASGVTGGFVDGCVVRVVDAVDYSASASAIPQGDGAVYFERDPDVARSAAIIRFGTSSLSLGTKHIWWRDITLARTRGQSYTGQTQMGVFENVNLDNNSASVALWGSGTLNHGYVMGLTVTNGAQVMFPPTAAAETRMIRGLSLPGGNNWPVEGSLVIGSVLSNCNMSWLSGRISNSVVAFTKFMNQAVSHLVFGTAAHGDVSGFAYVQCVSEYVAITNSPSFRPSSDDMFSNVTHLVMDHLTMDGWDGLGRSNMLYNETDGTVRTHKLCVLRNSIMVQICTKHDVFAGMDDGLADASTRVQSWAFREGVDCEANLSCHVNSDGTQNGTGGRVSQSYAGARSAGAPDVNTPLNPGFVRRGGTKSNTVVGDGNGDYHLAAGSMCIGRATRPTLKWDIEGVARGAVSASGAYAASAGN